MSTTDSCLLRELFEAAADLQPAARMGYLDAHCPAPLRAKLEAMLRADADTGEPVSPRRLGELAGEIGDAVATAPPTGSRIGPFEILGLLGEGGYSTVLHACRVVAGATQEVALKLLHRSLHSPEARQQFRREQRALLALHHPNIARMIEGGVTDDGRPYIALELVRGSDIVEHARRHKLDLRARLGLFVVACRAVDAAHRALIVHRDLKPSNVLVDDEGEVKRLDFGIAKVLEGDDEDQRTVVPAFTPAYAAPEQRFGGAITTATDVYALGVLLGELVTGQRLNNGSGRTPSSQVEDATAPERLPAPPRETRRLLRGDLDAIVLKAIDPDPARRYASAGAFADDIGRLLAGQPVAAHAPTRWYRARKFVARHKGGVAGTLVFVLAILAALGIALWQAQVARQQARRAAEVQAFVEQLFDPLDKGSSTATAPTLAELLQHGRDRIDQRYPDDPGVRADLLAMFARIGDALGETHDNLALAEAAARANQRAYGDRDSHTIGAREIYARVLRKVGDYAAARTELDGLRASLRSGDMPPQRHAQLLDALGALGKDTGMPPAEVIALEREALARRESDPVASLDDLATGYNNLGSAYAYANDHAQAMPWLEKAYSTYYAYHGDSLSAASTLFNLGTIQVDAGNWSAGASRHRDARAMFARIPIERHPALSSLLVSHCGALVAMELLDEADRICAEGEAMVLALHGREHRQFAIFLQRRARLHLAHGRSADAHADFDAARAIARGIGNAGDRDYLLATIDAGQSRDWWLRQDFPALRDAMLSLLSSTHPRLGAQTLGGFHYASLAALACRRAPAPACGGDRVAAAAKALADPLPHGHALRLPSLLALAEADAHAAGITAPMLEQALADAAPNYGPRHSIQVQAHRVLAARYAETGDPAAAAMHLAQAEQVARVLPFGHPLRSVAGD